MRNRILLFILIFFFTKNGIQAQQLPHYTQYILNQYAINPALSGIENYADIKMSHRRQWTGLEGAPLTSYFTFHTPLGNKESRANALTVNLDDDQSMNPDSWKNYEASPAHHGIGVQLFNDRIGPFNDFNAYITYAYHLPLGVRTNLAAGVGAGIGNLSLNSGKLFFGNINPTDPSVNSSYYLNNVRFNFKAGLFLYSEDYFAGISVQEILPQKIDFNSSFIQTQNGNWVPHIFCTAGYRVGLSEDIQWVPSIMLKWVNPTPIQFDINSKIQYKNLIWAGLSYRHLYGFAGMTGVQMTPGLQLSYSYDYAVTPLNQVSNGSHEFLLGFLLRGKNETNPCPRNLL
jgi:type IX secretion system PorP/SprF family membrane protein